MIESALPQRPAILAGTDLYPCFCAVIFPYTKRYEEMIDISSYLFSTVKTPDSSHVDARQGSGVLFRWIGPQAAAVAECLCRQGRTGIAIFATRMGHPQEFLWSFRRAGGVKFMMAPFLSSLLPWIVHRRDWKDLRQALSPLWSYSLWEGRVFS